MLPMVKRTLVPFAILICLLLIAAVSVWLIFRLPDQELRALKSNLTEKEFVELKNTIRLTFAQILGGAFVLIGTILERANLTAVHLELADMEDVHLEDGTLKKAYLLGANLKNAKLRGANLFGAYFGNTRISKENPNLDDPNNPIVSLATPTNLTGADLRGANLSNINLVDCILNDTDLRGANLSNTAITSEQLKLVKIDTTAKLRVFD